MDHFCYLCFMFVLFFLSVHCSLVDTSWERVDLLAFLYVMFYYALSLFHVVFRVRCGV